MAKIDLDEVRELLQGKSREEILAYVRKLMPVEARQKTAIKSEHGKPTTYTTVVKSYKCIGCGSRFEKRYNLAKNDDVLYIDPEGKAHNVRVSGRAGEVVVPCLISKCFNCACMASIWSREELELRFLTLLRTSNFKEIAVYSLIIKEVKRVEDFISHTYVAKQREETLSTLRCEGEGGCSPCCVCRQGVLDFSIPKLDSCASANG
jgi:hypothetical protein